MRRSFEERALVGIAVVFVLLLAAFGLSLLGFRISAAWSLFAFFIWLFAVALLLASMFAQARRGHERHTARRARPEPPAMVEVSDLFETEVRRDIGGIPVSEGRLLAEPAAALDTLIERYRGSGWTPLISRDRDREAIVLLPFDLARAPRAGSHVLVHLGLLLATLVTTTWAGAMHQGISLLSEPARFAAGLPYSLSILLILGAHELGHYFFARRHGMNVSLPYFIPAPFGLGTFGAFIAMRSPARSRTALFDMAVAGPLAGLVFAIPALAIGLPLSQITTAQPGPAAFLMGGVKPDSSLLFSALVHLTLGDCLEGQTILLHPLAFAGWLGLLVTALNLIPIGQLDGGHIADSIFGQKAGAFIGVAAMSGLLALGLFVWTGLLFWAFIVFFIAGRKGLPPLNDITPLSPLRLGIGGFAFALLLAILLPVPRSLLTSLGVPCPYL